MKCKICGGRYRHLGSHIWHAHKILANEYKMEFGLPLNYSLIDEGIKLLKQEDWQKHKKKYLKNLAKGKKFQFRQGKRMIKGYWSAQCKRRSLINLITVNRRNKRLKSCPVCKMKVFHLESHLYNKHKLLIVA